MSTDAFIDPSGRVTQVKGGNLQLPAVCIMCGVSGYDVDKDFLDIMLDKEMEVEQNDGIGNLVRLWIDGKVYFCLDCGREIGIATGLLVERHKLETAEEELAAAQAEQARLTVLNTELGDTLERDLLRHITNPGSPAVSSVGGTDNLPSKSDDEESSFIYGDFTDSVTNEHESELESGTDSTESTESVTSVGPDESDELTDDNKQRSFVGLEL